MTGRAENGSVLWYCWRRAGLSLRAALPGFGAGALSCACGVGLLATSGWLITRASERPPVLSLCVAIGAVQAFSLGRGLARYGQRLGAHGLSLQALGRLRLHLFDTVVPQVPGGLRPGSQGEVLSGFISDTEAVAEGFARSSTAALDVTVTVMLGAVVAGAVEPRLGAVVLAGGVGAALISALGARLVTAAQVRATCERARLADVVANTVLAAAELVAYGRQDLVQGQLEEVERRSRALAWRRAWALGSGRAAVVLVGGAATLFVTALGLAAARTGQLSGVAVAVAVFCSLAVMDVCGELPRAMDATSAARASMARLVELETRPVPAADAIVDASGSSRPPGVGGSAELVNVTVVLGGQRLLSEVSARVGRGEHTALVGPSGAGKSTCLHALLHFVACSGGEALLGGADVSALSRESLASLASWAPGDVHVFSASLRDNLRIARSSATDEECSSALCAVGLGPLLAGLADGLATPMGVGGRRLSGGEAQRIGIARGLLARAPMLLVDEPTARLDSGTAQTVLNEVLRSSEDRSVLVVSHDHAVRNLVDTVVELDEGEVVSVSGGGRARR
ncbi:MAG TPA: thiol reductant ABC exporter subunit CydC [Acidimicrobiales bacterium]|nr:thiol reductant ABC exporter subunit CydC [Acidimicrobiales bacterium]